MHRGEDDLSGWSDDPLVRALTAPGTPAELSGEAEALAAFRAAVPARGRRRFAGRFGAGASTFVVAVALSGGVAAAYTQALPNPLQRVAHGLLGPVGVPGPARDGSVSAAGDHHHHRAHPHSAALTAVSTLTPPGASPRVPAPTPSAGGVGAPRPGSTAGPASGSGSATTPTTAPTPVSTPAPSPRRTKKPAPVPAALVASSARQRVPAGSGLSISGHLTSASGAAVPGHRVELLERPAGSSSWAAVAAGRTGAQGYVTIRVPPLMRNTRLVLAAGHGVHSSTLSITVVPVVSTNVSRSGHRQDVAVSIEGGEPGDAVVLQRRRNGSWVKLATATLDGSGTASFRIPTPRASVHCRVILQRTSAHAAATRAFEVSP